MLDVVGLSPVASIENTLQIRHVLLPVWGDRLPASQIPLRSRANSL
jgi:hypothetical protein